MFVMDLKIGPKHNTLKGRQVDNKQINKKIPQNKREIQKQAEVQRKEALGTRAGT